MAAALDALAAPPPPVNGVLIPAPSSDNGALSSAPDSPALPSPESTNAASPAVKIDIDYLHRDSDARHEPISISLDKLDDASTRPQFGTPADPDSIPIAPPKGTPPPPTGQLLDDVQMAEQATPPPPQPNGVSPSLNGMGNGVNGVNGHTELVEEMNVDIDTPTPAPASSARDSPSNNLSNGSPSSSRLPEMNGSFDDGSDQPPPAKRARKLSDAEQASLAHIVFPPPKSPAAAPPPSTTATSPTGRSATPTPQAERKATLSQAQFRFCISTVRTLRKLKDAIPFLLPVDSVALNIPHYPTIIKVPMDFSTIDRKLASSNPAKPDANLSNPRYLNADEFIADVRRIFQNCVTFNGPDHAVSLMGKRVEAVFDKQIKQLPPPAEEPKPQVVKKPPTPPPPPTPPAVAPPAKKAPAARRPSTSVPTIRRSDTTETARPKREIHPPPPKDLPYTDPPKKARAVRKVKQNDGTEEQLKFCAKILAELHKKSLYQWASPFYEPVDPIKLNIPTYYRVVKKPMDLATMKKKLENKEYLNADRFHDDFTLMIRNCMAFNPTGTVVHTAGVELQRVFEEKWASLPPLRGQSDDEDEEEEDDSEDERTRTIAMMESQIETMRGNLAALKSQGKKPKEKKKEKKRERHVSPPVASSSRTNGKNTKSAPKKKNSKKSAIPDDDVLSFDQKKDLSETIQGLDGDKLEKVISIIHEGVPEIRDSTEEIELDIDQLPAPVLMKLYNFVLRPLRTTTKRARTGTGTGTGGLKRKSMDEDVEAEKIRQLEERMRMFDSKQSGGVSASKRDADSEHSSDESSSDSSGSDSE